MDILSALKDGYSKSEVMEELGRRTGMNYKQALSDGYSEDDVLGELNRRDLEKKATQEQQTPGLPASGVTRSFAQDAPSPDILEKPASLDFIKEERPKDTATVGGEAWKGVKSGLRSYLESTASLNVYGDQINDTDLAEKIKNAKSAGEKTFYETQEAEEKKNRLFRKEIGEEQQKDAAAVGDIRDIESVSDFGKWASWNMGQMGGQMLGIIPFMLGGGKEKAGAEVAVSGFQALKSLVSKTPGTSGQFGKFLAQWAKPKAVDIPIGVLEGGSIAGGQLDEVEQGKDTELHPFRGLAAAFVATKLEELGAENAVNNLIKGIGGKKGNLIKRIAQSTVGTGVGEGTEEFFQTYAEQFGINPNDIASKETFMQAVNGAAAGFIGGFGIGGVTGSLSRNKDVEPEPGTPDQQLTDTSLSDAINQGGHKDLDDASLEAAIQTASELVNQNPNDAETFNILNSLQAEAEARKQASLETETIMPQVETKAEQAAPDYSALITTHAEQNGIEPSLLSAVAQADGGLMAISPQVAQYMGMQDAQDPDQNLEGGARYLSALLQHYQGNEVKALAAYKMGVAAVNDQFRIESAPKEVQDYIASVQNLNPTGLIDSGLRTGQVNGQPFGPNEAVSLIQQKMVDGTFTKDHLNALKDKHPVLSEPLNDLIAASLAAEINQAVGITDSMEGGLQDGQTQKTETLLNTVSPYSHTMGAPVSTPFGQQQTPTYMLGKEISGPKFTERPANAPPTPLSKTNAATVGTQDEKTGGATPLIGSTASWTRGKETFSGTIQSIDEKNNLKIKAENGKIYSIRPDKVQNFKIETGKVSPPDEIVDSRANKEAVISPVKSQTSENIPVEGEGNGKTAVIPRNYATKDTTTTFDVAGVNDTFKIQDKNGAEITGYWKNQDFPNDTSKSDRGELFLTTVPESARGKGIGLSLNQDAIRLMLENGTKTVNLHATSPGGKRIVERLIKDGFISEPIRESASGKTEHRITLEGKPILAKADQGKQEKTQQPIVTAEKKPKKGPQNLITRIMHEGGLKVSTDYSNKYLKQYPDLKRIIRNNGVSPDDMAAILKDEGYLGFETGDDLIELLKDGKGKETFTPENLDDKIESQIRSATNEWIEQQLAELEVEGIDAERIEASSGEVSALAIEDFASEGLIDPADEEAAIAELDDFFSNVSTQEQSVKESYTEKAKSGTLETAEIPGASFVDTFTLAPSPGALGEKPKPHEGNKTANLFEEPPVTPKPTGESGGRKAEAKTPQFIKAPDGALNFGEITDEVTKQSEGKYPAGPIRLEEGGAYGKSHIASDRIQEFKDFGYKDELYALQDIAKNYTDVYKQANGRLLLVKRNGRGKFASVELQENGGYYGVTTWFLEDANPKNKTPYEERGGRELLLHVARADDSGQSSSFPESGNKDQAENSRRSNQSEPNLKHNLHPSSPEVNTEDSGAELTYNKRNRIKSGIKWEDISNKNTTLKVKETTKQNVYPKPDYQKLIDDGTHSLVAHLIKQVYDSIPVGPVLRKDATDDDLKLYITAVNRVMDGVISWSGDTEALAAWAKKQANIAGAALGRGPVSIHDTFTNVKSLLDTVYPNGWKEYMAEIKILGGNKLLKALQPGYDETTKAIKEVDKGWPAKQEAWQRQGWKVVATKDRATVKGDWSGKDENGEWQKDQYGVTVENHVYGKLSKTKEEAEATLATLKPYLLLDKYGRIKEQFDTEEAAKDFIREKTKKEGKTSTVKDKGISVEMAQRTGLPEHRLDGENVTSDQLKDAFGFKGVNFGNWMKGDSNTAERQLHLNHAYDSFLDLAEILGVPPKAMSLNGMLGLAIGAQGTGAHAAHFVPGVNEINLTRTSGAGSLGHEFGHALDHYFGKQAGLEANREPFLTEHVGMVDSEGYTKRNGQKVKAFGENVRPEIVGLFQSIVRRMSKKAVTVTPKELAAEHASYIDVAKSRVKRWLKAIRVDFERQKGTNLEAFDRLTDRIINLDLGEGKVSAGGSTYFNPVVAELRDLYKKASGRVYSIEQMKGLQSNLDHYAYLNSEGRAEKDHVPQSKEVSTDYAKNAAKLDAEKGGKPYWNTNLEKFARAFDAFISDTLEKKAAENTYLSHAGRIGETVPANEERTAINKAFQKLVDEIQTRETDTGVEMYSLKEEEDGTTRSPIPQPVTDQGTHRRPATTISDGANEQTGTQEAVSDSEEREKAEGKDRAEREGYGVVKKQATLHDTATQIGKTASAGVTESDLKELFPGQRIKKIGDRFIVITKNGGFFTIDNVETIDPNNGKIMLGYGRRLKQNEVIAGSYLKGEIKISKAGDKWTLAHESIHYLEDAGLLDDMDIKVLRAHIRRLAADGNFTPTNKADIGGAEDRADFLAMAMRERPKYTGLAGRVMDKIYKIIDALGTMFGKRTAGAIAREVKSGDIYNKEAKRTLGASSQSAVTQSLEFKKWFGNSKVVDENGKPLVVYHGTNNEGITVFDPEKAGTIQTSDWGKGIYFTPSKWMADGYRIDAVKSQDKTDKILWGEFEDAAKKMGTTPMNMSIDLGFGSNKYRELQRYADRWEANRRKLNSTKSGDVYGVYVSLQNPLIYTYEGLTDLYLAERAKSKGYDGIIIKERDGSIGEVVAFSSTQIKSATANVGTFDAENPDIRYKTVEGTTSSGPEKPRKLKTVEELVAWLNQQSKAASNPLEDAPERKQSSLSKKAYRQALKSTLIAEDRAPDVLEYDVMPMQEQADLAADLINRDIEKAKRIALGQEEPEGKLRKGTVYRAIELWAHDQGDTELIAKLIRSPISLEMTKQGQEIAATRKKHLMETLGMKYYESPVNAVKDVEDTLSENVEKKTGKRASKEAVAEAEAWEKKLSDLEQTIADQAAEIKKYTSQEYIDELISKHAPAKEGKTRTAKPKAEYGAKNKVFTQERHDKALNTLKGIFGRVSANPMLDPQAHAALVELGGYHFEAGARKFAEWAQRIVDDVGPGVKPHLRDTFEKVKDAFGIGLMSKIKKGIEKGRDLGELQRHVNDLAISFIEEGVTDGNELVEAVYNELQQIDPDITLEETRDAISGYGKWTPLTHDEVLDRYREIKQEQQLLAKIRDLEEQGAMRRTGTERQEMTQLARDLNKQVHALKIKYGMTTTEENQLPSALESYKKRLNHQIADLDEEIKSKQKIVKEKFNLELDAEAKELIQTRDSKKAEREAIFGKPEMTDEQRIKLAIQAAKKATNEYNRRIAEHDFSSLTKKGNLTSEELTKARKDRDDAKKAYQELREAENPGAAAMKALETRLNNELNRYKQMIANRDFSRQERKPRNLTPELKRLMEQRDTMRMGVRAAAEAAGRLANEDIERIAKLASVVTELRESLDNGGDRFAYGASVVAYHNYIEDLKGINDPIKTLLSNRIQQYKAEYKENPGKAIFNLASDSIKSVFDNSVAMVASFDDSFMGRQGLKVLFTHPSAWWPGAKNSVIDFIKTLGGQETIDAMKADIYSRPNFVNGSYGKAGIIAAYEEQYPANLAERAPVIGRVFKASEAAFVGSGMRMRADLYDLLADQAKSNGKDVLDQKEFIEPIGKLINNLTARGSWGKHRGESRVTRLILWAPKMLMANINTLVGVDYWTNLRNPTARREAGLNWLKVIGTTALIMAVASALGGDDDWVEWDPRSTDFGKIKIGDTRFDITGGMGSIVVLAARIITGKKKSATTGIVQGYTGDSFRQSRLDAFVQFLINKTTPPMGIVRDWLEGKTPTGERFTPEGAIYRAMTPIAVQNFIKLKDSASADRLAGAIVDVFGINTSSYSDSERQWNPNGSQREQKLYQRVGEKRFQELNKEYNTRVDSHIKELKRDLTWQRMSDEDKQAKLDKGRERIKAYYLGK